MKLTKEALTEQYGKLTLTQLEDAVKSNAKDLVNLDKVIIGKLWYIKFSLLYREDPRYKKVSWASYLDDKFKIRERSFDSKLRIYAKYGDDATDLGVGLISKVEGRCGVLNTPSVIKEIKDKRKSLKKPITRMQIEKVINEHSKPTKIRPHKIDWRHRFEVKDKENKENLGLVEELTKQNEKLKNRVRELEGVENMMRDYFQKTGTNG